MASGIVRNGCPESPEYAATKKERECLAEVDYPSNSTKRQRIPHSKALGDLPCKLENGAAVLAAFFFLPRPALFSLKLLWIEFELEPHFARGHLFTPFPGKAIALGFWLITFSSTEVMPQTGETRKFF